MSRDGDYAASQDDDDAPLLRSFGDHTMGDAEPMPMAAASSALNLSHAAVLDVVQEGRHVMAAFLRATQCYDVIKNSGKVVVFDVQIPINLAFFALVEHGTTWTSGQSLLMMVEDVWRSAG